MIKCKYNQCQSGHTITPTNGPHQTQEGKQKTSPPPPILFSLKKYKIFIQQKHTFVREISEGFENDLRTLPNVLFSTISINSPSMLGLPSEHSQHSFDSCISISLFKISTDCTNPYFSKATNPDCTKFSVRASKEITK